MESEEKGGEIMPKIFLKRGQRDFLIHIKQLLAKTEVF